MGAVPVTTAQPLTGSRLVSYNLARVRRERGLTAEQAAKMLEPHIGQLWSRSTFSVAESTYTRCTRLRQFTVDELIALSVAFEVSPAYFLTPPVDRLDDAFPGLKSGRQWLKLLLGPETVPPKWLDRLLMLTRRERKAVESVVDAILASRNALPVPGVEAVGFAEGVQIGNQGEHS